MQYPSTELTRPALTRFLSAPPPSSSWIDALLDDLHDPNPIPPVEYVQPATPDPVFYGGAGGSDGLQLLQRMTSSPADFLSANVDVYFSTLGRDFGSGGGGVGGGNYTDVSGAPSRKRSKKFDSEQYSPSMFAGQRRGKLATANTLIEMEMDKLLEDSVPCRVRAKRGFATHPRSIAERVRRTRISDRIRKLQELVPDMDKQTSTSDMLEEAVQYVKTLQSQIQELTEQQKKCKCMLKSEQAELH